MHCRCLADQGNNKDTDYILNMLAKRLQYDPDLSLLDISKVTSGLESFSHLKDTSFMGSSPGFTYMYNELRRAVPAADMAGLVQLLQRCYCPNHPDCFANPTKPLKEYGADDLPRLSYLHLWNLLLVSHTHTATSCLPCALSSRVRTISYVQAG